MQAANHDALEVASQRAIRRHVKVLESWGTDGTKEDTGKQAQVLRENRMASSRRWLASTTRVRLHNPSL